MIYVKQSFDLEPAAPSTRDRVVEVMNEQVLPAQAGYGARLVGAWFAHEEWFNQVIHVTEFDDLSAFDAYRAAAAVDGELGRGIAELAALAPGRFVELLEPLGPIAAAKLHDAIEACADDPVETYTFAILEVAPGRLEAFSAMLAAAAGRLPIIACWHGVSGNPRRVVDLWKGDTGRGGYRPNDDAQEAFFGPLREIAPRERMMRLHPMPYSPLR